MHEFIAKFGMGYFDGLFTLTTTGRKPNYRGKDWPGEEGETVVAEAVEVGGYHTWVYIDGIGYNGVCFTY